MVPIALGFIVYLLWRAPGHVRVDPRHDPREPGRARRGGLPRLRAQRLRHRRARRDARRGQRVARVPHGADPPSRRPSREARRGRVAARGAACSSSLVALGGAGRRVAGESRTPPTDRRVLVISVPGLTLEGPRGAGPPEPRAPARRERGRQPRHPRHAGGRRARARPTSRSGAGTRAVAPREVAGLAFEADEPFGAGHRRPRSTPGSRDGHVDDEVRVPQLGAARRRPTTTREFGGTIGALGRGARGRRGRTGRGRQRRRRRPARAGRADPPGGGAGAGRRRRAPSPAGRSARRCSPPTTPRPSAFGSTRTRCWTRSTRCSTPGSVVLVEASDLRRAAGVPRPGHRRAGRRGLATRRSAATDALVGELLERARPRAGRRRAWWRPTTQPEPGLGVLGIRADGAPAGLLTSGQHPARGLRPAHRPHADDRRAGRRRARRGEHRGPRRRVRRRPTSTPRSAIARSSWTGRRRRCSATGCSTPSSSPWSSRSALLALAAGGACRRAGGTRCGRSLERVALALLAFPSMTYLAALLPFHDWGSGRLLGVPRRWVGASLGVLALACCGAAWLRPLGARSTASLVAVVTAQRRGARLPAAARHGVRRLADRGRAASPASTT